MNQRISAEAFVPIRLALGLSFFAYYLFSFPQLDLLYSDQGYAGFVYPEYASWFRPPLLHAAWVAALVSLFFFSVGLRTRTAGFLFLIIHVYFNASVEIAGWGWLRVAKGLFLFTLFANPGAVWSVDAWLAKGKPRDVSAPIWVVRLVQLHVSCIYLAAALHRVNDPGWLSGEMVFFALDFNTFSRFPYVDFTALRPLLVPVCWGALLIELAGIVAPWWGAARKPVLYALIAMHLGLEIATTTGRWQSVLVGALLTILIANRPKFSMPSGR